jgi:L-alanine-DL-glutamate epimerase-like enolase superfamily enzyme
MSQGKPTDVRIRSAEIEFESAAFRAPLKFGGRVVTHSALANVEVVVESHNGRYMVGHGSMPLGNVWAWPSPQVEPAASEEAMKKFAGKVVELFGSFPDYAHPLEIEYAVSAEYDHLSRKVAASLGVAEPLPELAQLTAASPVDAALHDAYGRLHKLNCFNTLSKEFCNVDLSEFLDGQFAGEYADQYTRREPVASLPLYHLVGALDPLTSADVTEPLNDGLPVTLGEWIRADGLTHLKIKLNGDNLEWDVDRVLSIERVAAEAQSARGCTDWVYSCDFNEKCRTAEYVIEFLHQVKEKSPAAFERIQYIEQPTSRNLDDASAPRMHAVSAIRPVVIDEALVSYDALLQARDLGYSGVALKACKGQRESITMAAAAQKFDMFLCVQDLTCPGASFMHSCSLAARIPGVAAIEGNARQYCPAANEKCANRFPGLFTVKSGKIDTSLLTQPGLGFNI